ncbi:hypothetical protein IFM89_032537 [Coptis chinensis]|uniref:Exostosin GT47 domain-containing protein n=1 Tax=Coptis chinensis TaxID=261450 RepID=A0A835IT82_9MAGN|nr:hypothetical protein IFM89_032537 [Coptis chinensis]
MFLNLERLKRPDVVIKLEIVRTGGAEHFLIACHDWAPHETVRHMSRCIRALCNADVNEGFVIGKDVSLPETNVRRATNPLRDLGGKPPSKRQILAFFAGGMHGYLRPILLQYWENKDPDMKISSHMGHGTKSKANYVQHMKNSKYCICAKGFEVNNPRGHAWVSPSYPTTVLGKQRP